MKILFIIDSLSRGGKERRLVQLLKKMQSIENINIELILLSESVQYDEVFDFNMKIHFLKRRIKKDISIFYKIYRICSEFKPDIVHSWGTMPSIYILPTVLLKKNKLINSSIVDAPEKLSLKIWSRVKPVFPFSDIIVANSNAGLKSYNVSLRKGRVIYNGFDFDRVKDLIPKEEIKKRFNIKTEYLIGMVSVFRMHKDHGTIISSAIEILKSRKDITFILVGDGPTFEQSKILAKNNPCIIFTGKQKDVESIMNACDIGVLTTNIKLHGEGISNSILEFMAVGKPVIATNGGGTNEIVINNLTGYLVEQENREELINKILYLINNEDVRIKMGNESKKQVEDNFNLEKMVKSFCDLYEEIYPEKI